MFMSSDLPFEPVDAYESLSELLPAFTLGLPRSDLKSFIINGSVTRRFLLRGRFSEFGHTRVMRSSEELTVDSFLNDAIPKGSPEPLYNGDAVGCKFHTLRS
jgi:hypothetical protein